MARTRLPHRRGLFAGLQEGQTDSPLLRHVAPGTPLGKPSSILQSSFLPHEGQRCCRERAKQKSRLQRGPKV